MRHLPRALAASVWTLVAACLAPGVASAQGISTVRFEPSFAGDKLFGVQSPYGAGDNQLLAMLLMDYAHDPLVVRDGVTGNRVGAIVADQTILHLHASYALFRALTFDLDVPFGFQHGEQPAAPGGGSFAEPTTAAVGDVRLGARATLYGAESDPFQLALAAMVWAPSGSRAAFLSDGQTRAAPMLVAGGSTRYFVWAANLGVEIRPESRFVTLGTGSAMRWGAGIGFLPGDGRFQVGPEVTGAAALKDGGAQTVDVELMAGAKARLAKVFVAGLAAGAGVSSGFGTPDFRTVLSFSYAPLAEPPPEPDLKPAVVVIPVPGDRDGDGIPDDEDACPDLPGVRDVVRSLNGCPPDADNDGIPDSEDACPDKIGPRDPDPKKNGCPLPSDRDGDGIPDTEDACPDVPGSPSPDPKKNGCPGDRDKDGIPDDKDACPDEKGPADPDPKKNGCPKEVRIGGDHIVLLQEVEFDLNRASIRPASNALLATITQVLNEHPEILKVEVEGHTDDRGVAAENRTLSQRRAEAVVEALVKRGIAPGRLTAVGYGSTKPIMSNITTMGRQKNRRVELHILERASKP